MTVPRLTGVNRDNRPHDWPPLPPCLVENIVFQIAKSGFVGQKKTPPEGQTAVCDDGHIRRGYESFDARLRALGADICLD